MVNLSILRAAAYLSLLVALRQKHLLKTHRRTTPTIPLGPKRLTPTSCGPISRRPIGGLRTTRASAELGGSPWLARTDCRTGQIVAAGAAAGEVPAVRRRQPRCRDSTSRHRSATTIPARTARSILPPATRSRSKPGSTRRRSPAASRFMSSARAAPATRASPPTIRTGRCGWSARTAACHISFLFRDADNRKGDAGRLASLDERRRLCPRQRLASRRGDATRSARAIRSAATSMAARRKARGTTAARPTKRRSSMTIRSGSARPAATTAEQFVRRRHRRSRHLSHGAFRRSGSPPAGRSSSPSRT